MVRTGLVTGPVSGSRPPFGAPSPDDLAELGYVVEEFLLEGETVSYELAPGTEPVPTGRWSAVEAGEAPYRTRLLVIRPASPDRFNGTVLVNWQNVSAGYEAAAPTRGELYEGYAWVGVSAQEIGLYGLPAGVVISRRGVAVPPLIDYDPARYGNLRHPGDPGAYEMFRQAGLALWGDRDGVDPLGGLVPLRLVAMGGSQSAMRLVAYCNAVHPLGEVFDAFLLNVWEGRAPRPEEGPISFGGHRTRVRPDLGVPVLIVNSEFEAPHCAALAITDTDAFRMWEVTGTPHGVATGHSRPDARGRIVNRLSYGPVHQAAIRAMHHWLTDGVTPNSQPRMTFTDLGPPAIVRDELGNGIGGIRLPELEAPVAAYHGNGLGPARAPLFGFAELFDDELLRRLYPTPATFVQQWNDAVDALLTSGALRPEDAPAMRARGEAEAALLPTA